MTPTSPDDALTRRPAVHRDVEASADDVWSVLADGWAYATWVVGAARVRSVDERWPAPGAAIEHSVGTWPLLLSDSTTVEACDPGRRLVLTARGWPLGEARVLIELEGQKGFDGYQAFLATVHALSSSSRLSRFAFVAERA